MSWAVGYDRDHDRWRGYGVPAYCDAAGCGRVIDRGLDSACWCADHEDDDPIATTVFVCGEHSCADVNEANLPPEHPDWVQHLLTDHSWQRWRDENPTKVARLTSPAQPAADPNDHTKDQS